MNENNEQKSDLTKDEKEKILKDFEQKMIENTIDLDPDMVRILNDNFWELI